MNTETTEAMFCATSSQRCPHIDFAYAIISVQNEHRITLAQRRLIKIIIVMYQVPDDNSILYFVKN